MVSVSLLIALVAVATAQKCSSSGKCRCGGSSGTADYGSNGGSNGGYGSNGGSHGGGYGSNGSNGGYGSNGGSNSNYGSNGGSNGGDSNGGGDPVGALGDLFSGALMNKTATGGSGGSGGGDPFGSLFSGALQNKTATGGSMGSMGGTSCPCSAACQMNCLSVCMTNLGLMSTACRTCERQHQCESCLNCYRAQFANMTAGSTGGGSGGGGGSYGSYTGGSYSGGGSSYGSSYRSYNSGSGGMSGYGSGGSNDPCASVCASSGCTSQADAHKPHCAKCAGCKSSYSSMPTTMGSGSYDDDGSNFGGSYGSDGSLGPSTNGSGPTCCPCSTPASTPFPTPRLTAGATHSPTAAPTPAPTPKPIDCVMTPWKTGGACSESCGGGTQSQTRKITRNAQHRGTACGEKQRSRGCNNFACPTYKFKTTRWYKCSHRCDASGGSKPPQQRRQISCVRSDGKTFSATHKECQSLKAADGTTQVAKPAATRTCNTKACATYIWQTSSWSKCQDADGKLKTCTGDDGISGKIKRTVKCIDSATKQDAADSLCPSAALETERICNTRKCVTYSWDIGAYSACSKTCGGGAMTRSVNCTGSDLIAQANDESCNKIKRMRKPVAVGKCNTAKCDKCAMVRGGGKECSGHGSCAAATGACTCTGGFTGPQCDAPPGCSGVLDKKDRCCLGTLNPDGTCCKSSGSRVASITADGGCCRSGVLDVCGKCDGTATAIDAIGTCCSPPGTIGEDSLCCPSGVFDTCGVCAGDDSSCNVKGGLTLAPPAGETADSVLADAGKLQTFKDGFKVNLVATLGVPEGAVSVGAVVKQNGRRRLLQGVAARRLASGDLDASFQIEQAKVSAAGGAAKSAVDVTSSLADAAASGSGAFSGATVAAAEPAAVCGNGACEGGERCTDSTCSTGCTGDCPYQVKACPTAWWTNGGECAGRGKCIGASGACDCFTKQGYVGAACDECADGYVMRPSTRECVRVLSTADKATDTTPAPTPMRSDVKVPATVTGYTTEDFTAAVLNAYRTAWSAKTGANLGDVDVRNVASARRRLSALELRSAAGHGSSSSSSSSSGRDSGGGRLLAAASVKFDVFVSLKDPTAASDYETRVQNVGDAELLQSFGESLTAAGESLPAGLATTKSAPSTVPITSAPTPAPPPAVVPRAPYVPSDTVKRLHKYMKNTGRVDEQYDPKKTVEAAGAVAVVAAVAGVLMLLLYVLFMFCQKCCKSCKCCYKAHLSEAHHCRAKVIQTFLFLLFCGLLCGSVKGRDSFHKAADTLAPALSQTAGLFNEMEAGAVGMVASSGQFDAGFTTLTACSPTKCGACPWPGDEAKNGREADWDKSARTLLIGSDANGGAAATMRPQIATFKEQGGKLHKMLKGQGAQLQKISDSMAKDGKKYIDAFIGVTIAFGFLVAALGIVGVWCLSEKKGCHFSSLFLVLAQVLGLLFVVLLIVLVTLQASTSAFLAEVCYQPVPETTLIDTLTQDGTYNVLNKEQFDVPTLKYYFTCNGTNALGTKLEAAMDQIAGLDPELRRVQECDTLALRKAVPGASAAMANVQYALSCPRVQSLLLTFTRDAVCTHMVDGLFFLWAVQASAGMFLIVALFVMRLVMQSFHMGNNKQQGGIPMAGIMPQQPVIPQAMVADQLTHYSKANPQNTV